MPKTRLEMVKEVHYKKSPMYAAFLLELAELYHRLPPDGLIIDKKTGASRPLYTMTSWTDGKTINVNLNFMESMNLLQGDMMFCHEEMHVILKHHLRRKKHVQWMVTQGMEECH